MSYFMNYQPSHNQDCNAKRLRLPECNNNMDVCMTSSEPTRQYLNSSLRWAPVSCSEAKRQKIEGNNGNADVSMSCSEPNRQDSWKVQQTYNNGDIFVVSQEPIRQVQNLMTHQYSFFPRYAPSTRY